MLEEMENYRDVSRVGQFFQVSPTVPLLCRVFHPVSKNGLFSVLRWINKLHSVPVVKPSFWPFLTLWALNHFFRLAIWNYKQNTTFGTLVEIDKSHWKNYPKLLTMGCFTTPMWVNYGPNWSKFQRALFEKIMISSFGKIEFYNSKRKILENYYF